MAKKPRHSVRPQAKSSLVAPALRRGSKNRPASAWRRSRFEQLEDRRVLAAFTLGDIVVEQINATNNNVTPTSALAPVFLHEFSTSGTDVQTLALPTTASGSNNPLTIGGTAPSEGELSLSANGAYLVVSGYDATLSGTKQQDSTIGLVDANGNINTSTTTSLLTGNNTRGAASEDGTSVWVTGPAGVVYETTGTNLGGTNVDSAGNFRAMSVVPTSVSPTGSDGLFASSNKAFGVSNFSPALPTPTNSSSTVLNGMTATTSPDSYGFFFANPTTMFVADANLGIQEWTLGSGTWTNVATLSGSYVGLTGVQSGNTVSLYATTGDGSSGRMNGNSLVSDTFTFNSGTTGTGTFGVVHTLATATSFYGFGGVAFAPQPASVVFSVTTAPTSTMAGNAVSVMVTAQYGNGPNVGQTDTAYTGTIAFTSSDPLVSPGSGLPTNYTFTAGNHGVASFSATLKTAGSQIITATDTGAFGAGAGNASVTVTPNSLHQLGISAPVDATSGIAFSITVAAQDQYGNTIPGYTGTVSFGGGGGGAILPSPYAFVAGDNGSHTFTGVTLLAGSATGTNQTITATDSGNSINGSAPVDDFVVTPFTAGDFVVYRVGIGGSSQINGASAAVFLDEYSPMAA